MVFSVQTKTFWHKMIRLSVILLAFHVYIILAENDEFYCKIKKDNWQVCRTCNETDIDCDGTSNKVTDKCRCEDIKLFDPSSNNGTLIGGWETCQTKGWCLVTIQDYEGNELPPNACSDQEDDWHSQSDDFSPLETKSERDGKPYIWMKSVGDYEGLSRSKEACKGVQHNIGNEDILEGVRIVGNRLRNIELNGTLAEELEFFVENNEDCKQECDERIGSCGAWSFDKENLLCYLHTVDSCCGQFGKRENDNNFISGYVCPICWSTKAGTGCPCSVKDRTEVPGTKHSTGGANPLHNSAAGLMGVYNTTVLADLCACERRRFPKNQKCRCVKPVCTSDPDGNPPNDGKCPDTRRCRKKPMNEKRFPKDC